MTEVSRHATIDERFRHSTYALQSFLLEIDGVTPRLVVLLKKQKTLGLGNANNHRDQSPHQGSISVPVRDKECHESQRLLGVTFWMGKIYGFNGAPKFQGADRTTSQQWSEVEVVDWRYQSDIYGAGEMKIRIERNHCVEEKFGFHRRYALRAATCSSLSWGSQTHVRI